MSRLIVTIISLLLIISIGLNVFFLTNHSSESESNYIDDDFTAALGRISGALERDDYFAAIEQANIVNALSKYTSFFKREFIC
ncbi:hypothetical protein [Paenibacillus harenae]|uniref:hypothetical protein n=1 Tax=Paenibacillus harenae TaxID=306543 RepID=UPI00048B947D|nr:hypothetical protein [Paenibacillus harenae]